MRAERGERSEPRDALEMKKGKTKRGKRGKRLTLAFSGSCLVSIVSPRVLSRSLTLSLASLLCVCFLRVL